MKKQFNNKGVTLIEIMIVIIIIGIISATIYQTAFKDAPNKARALAVSTTLPKLFMAEELYAGECGVYTNNINELDMDMPTSEWFQYSVNVTDSSFIATATVIKKFGKAAINDIATIDDKGNKTTTGGLTRYLRNWK